MTSIQDAVREGRVSVWVVRILSRPAVFGSLIPGVTLLNAIVGMLLPQMMQPQTFGEYSLVVTLFNYGLIFDLGTSQIMDRQIPALLGSGDAAQAQSTGETLLWLRFGIAIAALVITAAILLVGGHENLLPFGVGAGMFAALAGLADMVALGPVGIFRARSKRRNYAVMIAILLTGLVVARLGGLIAGGIIGCFAALSVWYIACAVLYHQTMPLRLAARPSGRQAVSIIGYGLPFFATSFIWAFYVTGNRWFASFLLNAHDFGQFAFSANIFSLLVGAIGGFSAFYYPRMAGQIANSEAFAQSGRLTRDLSRLIAASAIVMAGGIVLANVLVHMIYPNYVPSVATARVILVGVTPMIVASWLMPISQSASRRPWIDGVIIFPLATTLLGCAVFGLYRPFGVEGVAMASTVSALALVGTQVVALNHSRILRPHGALVLFSLTAASCAILGGLVWIVGR